MSIFKSQALTAAGPATDILPVTPNDGADLSFVASALYVETGGILSILTVRDQVRTIEVGDLSLLPVGVRRVRATGTTATGIHCAGGRMKLDYALQTNSATIAGKLAWSPARLFAKGQRGAFFFPRGEGCSRTRQAPYPQAIPETRSHFGKICQVVAIMLFSPSWNNVRSWVGTQRVAW